MMSALRVMALLWLASCAGPTEGTIELALGTASVSLQSSTASMKLTSDTEWSLTKHGTVDPTAKTVTWSITATKGTTTSGILIVTGTLTVNNTGGSGATIGNVVVNLQTRQNNNWITKSSDIADATQDDAATTANVVSSASSEGKSAFNENNASGRLIFMDAATNSAFALVPQVTIPAGATKTLLFTATFDNNVLHLTTGQQTRTEVILSYGNAASGGSSKPNIDINGNGIVDPDEARVRSVVSRISHSVPAQTPSNQTVTLTDTVSDITTTGTVTFTNPQITLGATTGTVTVQYDGGASGGTITNCAHLVGTATVQKTKQCGGGGGSIPMTIPSVNKTACDAVTIGPHTCSPGLPGCGWEAGDMVTYTQDEWGNPASTAGGLLVASFDTIYPGGLEVGILGSAGFSIELTDSLATLGYLPASGPPGQLNGDLIDPMSTASGTFGGDVAALQLDVDFSAANLLGGTSGLHFGDLFVCELTSTTSLNGKTVRAILADANTVLGGGSITPSLSAQELDPLVFALTQAFVNGDPSTFAQQNLFAGGCPP